MRRAGDIHVYVASLLAVLLVGCGDRPVTRHVLVYDCRPAGLVSAAKCATVDVPEDRSKPGGRVLSLSVAILPANTLNPDADPLFMLPGGPGQSAEALVPVAVALDGVRRTRDIVLVDPRGSGQSAPLKCPALGPRYPFDEPDPKLRATAAPRCLAELLASGKVDPSHYNTSETVADLDAVRAALGYERINLWGGSYGTRVAQEFARRYPARVRSMVLDGVVPPKMRITIDGWAAREAALADVVAACAGQEACRHAYPDLNATLGGIHAALSTVQKVEIVDPRTGKPINLPITFDSVVARLEQLLYAPELASLIPPLLGRAEAGDFAPLVAATAGQGNDLERQLNPALYYAVTCGEDAPRLTSEEASEIFAKLRVPSFAEELRAACEGWPRPALPADFYAPLTSDVPTLILSGGIDPVTPAANGQIVAESLPNSRHIVAAGYGHVVTPYACAPRLVEKFIDAAAFGSLPQSCIDYLVTSKRPPLFSSLLEPK